MVIADSGAGEAPDAIHLGYRLSGMVYIEEIVEQVNPFADESGNDAVKTFFIKDSKHDFASLDELRCTCSPTLISISFYCPVQCTLTSPEHQHDH